MPNAIIYARFSPRPNEDKCESIEQQIERCREYAKRNGLTPSEEFSDRALSGKDADRPGLWDAVEALRRGDTLLVYTLDRLARDVYLSYIIERQVEKRGAKIVSVNGEGTASNTPGDKLTRTILRALAEYQRNVTAARTSQAMKRHQKKGRRMSDLTPYGWRRDPRNKALMIEDAYEQDVIRQILELRDEGKGLHTIARELEKRGITCRGGNWWHTTVRNILKRERGGC